MGGGGKKGGGSSGGAKTSPYEEQLAKIAKGMYNQTAGMRKTLIGQGNDFLTGDLDVTQMPQFSPTYALGRQGLESQYGQAKSNLMGNMPQGGALQAALANLEGSRASAVGSLPASISGNLTQDLFNKTYGTAFGAPGQAMQGLGMANSSWTSRANVQSMVDQQQAQANSQLMGGLGQGIGMIASKFIPCCWIFLASTGGHLDPVVRRYRDEHVTERNRRGYYRLAEWIVPKMQGSRVVRSLVKWGMVEPMTSYGRWHYGIGRIGVLFAPVAKFWLGVYSLLGLGRPIVRSNGEVI
jgi:hypothetical protein